MNHFNVFVILVLSLVFLGCGSSGDSGGSQITAPPLWSGKVNSSGYPDVPGTYAFNTDVISYSCTDGSKGTSPALAMNLSISQTNNELLSTGSSTAPNSSVNIISGSQLKGNIEKTGNFIMNQSLVMTMTTVSGTNSVNYNVTGYFVGSGWTGTYKYSVYNNYYNATCSYSAAFRGDRISAKEVLKNFDDGVSSSTSAFDSNRNEIRHYIGFRPF